MYTKKDLREDVLRQSYFNPHLTNKLLKMWITLAQNEIFKLHPLFLPERNHAIIVLPNNDYYQQFNHLTTIPLWKEPFTLDDDWLLNKLLKIYNKTSKYQNNQVSIYGLSHLVNVYLNLIEQHHHGETYLGISGIINQSSSSTSTRISNNLLNRKPKEIEMSFYDLITKRQRLRVLSDNDYRISYVKRDSNRIL